MQRDAFEHHLLAPRGRGEPPLGASNGAAGSSVCGDLIRFSLTLDQDTIAAATFDASGCGAMLAAGSAAVALVDGRPLLDAARVGTDQISHELGGLSAAKRHAAELTADALHRALGAAASAGAALAPDPRRILVAMSGGVDSSVAALRCAQEGDAVVAVTLELWADAANDGERSCCSAHAVRHARALAHQQSIAHFTLDLREQFRAGVVDPYLASHAAGETPNPCVRCNGHVRLDAMLEFAGRLGAARLATGHYARIGSDELGPLLRLAHDPDKDQSYMLAALSPRSLERMRFPLGDLTKPEVRQIARDAGLAVAEQLESQDLCFLAGTHTEAFLARHGEQVARDGEIVDSGGTVLGRHRGQHGFTVGQRRGLGIASGRPLYVLAKDVRANRVVVGPREQLRRSRVAVRGATLHRDGALVNRVKLRYRARPLRGGVAGAAAAGRHRRLELALGEPVEGAAPGQTACLMAGDLVVGHGTIAT